jgi:hypothetical protein
MALKSANGGRQTHHTLLGTLSGHRVCRERALKSTGERNTHGGAVRGPSGFGKPPARGALGVSATGIQRRFGGGGYPLLAKCKVLTADCVLRAGRWASGLRLLAASPLAARSSQRS